jgi:glycosyltransferase involved in cell wall biosynthesis
METGYRIEGRNQTEFFFPVAFKKTWKYSRVCATVWGHSDIVCGRNPDEKHLFPSYFSGIVKVFWMLNYVRGEFEESETIAADTYILELARDPEIPARVELIDPPYGSIIPTRFSLGYKADAFAIANKGNVELRVPGITEGLSAPADMTELKSEADIEPGSWFLNMSVTFNVRDGPFHEEVFQTRTVRGYPTIGYIEYVLPPEDIEKNRQYATPWKGFELSNALPELSGSPKAAHERTRNHNPIHVCIWGSYVMDGQKNIYLQQIEFMNKSEFSFTWVAADPRAPVTEDNAVVNRLRQMPHARIVPSPYGSYQLDLSLITEDPGDGSPPASDVWEQKESKLYEYVSRRLRVAGDNIDKVTPLWARGLYDMMRRHFIEERCEIVVYGNSRGFSSNSLITDTARAMGVPTVSELLNLFIDPELAPSIVVAPSTYALEHERKQLAEDGVQLVTSPFVSTDAQKVLREGEGGGKPNKSNYYSPSHVVAVTISPSADLQRFDPDAIPSEQVIRHPHCQKATPASSVGHNIGHAHSDCFFTVGFVARLSVEKNVGLFLLAAHHLLQSTSFMRFTIVGDGDLKPRLMELARRLRIDWAVHFTGWVGADLPRVLKGFDVVVNPSLRAWSETFCIANIEVMSMRIPLVTFAVGGKCSKSTSPNGHCNAIPVLYALL